MQDDIKQKMSMLLDDELSTDESLRLLERIEDDVVLRSRWHRYNAASLALKSDAYVNLGDDFVANISEKIRNEPTVLVPQPTRVTILYSGWAAVAASVIIVAVIVVGNLPNQAEKNASVKMAQSSRLQFAEKIDSENEPADSRFEDYLEAHNESSYATVTPNLLPYARVVSQSRGR
ncbi:MAG: sigma-E factor negative regulatory protein [Pseudomonadota bacterium]